MNPGCTDRNIDSKGTSCSVVTFLVSFALFIIPGVLSILLPPANADDRIKAIRKGVPTVPTETGSPPTGSGDLYALVVGVSSYAEKSVPKLRLSAKDAEDFAKFLATQKRVFKQTHVKLLLNDKATKQEVEKFLYHDLRKAARTTR